MKKYYAYTRVSTHKQQEGMSTDVQTQLIDSYSRSHKLEIVKWFHETKTAATSSRECFKTLVKKLQYNHADGLILHTIDRGARNLKDWAQIGELVDVGIDVRFVQENLNLSARGSRLSADIQAVVAADYVRNLRQETMKGITYRLEQGLYPFSAPLGYLNNGSGKLKTIDPLRSPFVAQAFSLYSRGNIGLESLAIHMHNLGLRNTHMRMVGKNAWAKILKNPFYVGTTLKFGKTYPGLHEKLISNELFEMVQNVLQARGRSKLRKHHFIFQRLLICNGCKHYFSGEKQKQHTYYRCHTKSCDSRSIREDRLEIQMRAYFKKSHNSDSWQKRVNVVIQNAFDLRVKNQLLSAQKLSMENLRRRKEKLDDLYSDGLITRSDLVQKRKGFAEQIEHVALEKDIIKNSIWTLQEQAGYARDFLNGARETSLSKKSKHLLLQSFGLKADIANGEGIFRIE